MDLFEIFSSDSGASCGCTHVVAPRQETDDVAVGRLMNVTGENHEKPNKVRL
jgi:hypothetical protein